MKRNTMLKHVKESSQWDVIVIGGGASGLWCAYDAALRGFKTILIERGDFACSTSSKSTKLIHGGLRYLKQGHLLLVREALLERQYLAKNAPHLVKSLPFIIPYFKTGEGLFYGLGMGVYDFFAGSMGGASHKSLSAKNVLAKCPTLSSQHLKGGCLFFDGQFDDSRFAIELAKMAAFHECTLLNYVSAHSLIKQGGRVVGVEAKDELSGRLFELAGRAVINATGIFADEIRHKDDTSLKPMMTLARGTHIVLDRSFLPGDTALVLPKTKDGRLAFLIPWHEKVLLGTTDVKTEKAVQEPTPTREEIDFLLDAAGGYLTKKPHLSDIKSAFAGIRPLVRHSSKTTAKLVRSHKVTVSKSGLITIAGGKWTTARKMAEDTIDTAIEVAHLEKVSCKTALFTFEQGEPLHQGPLLHKELPYTEKDIEIALHNEMAVTLVDLLARRTRSLLLDVKAALEIAPKVALIAQKALHWSDEQRIDEIEKFKRFARSYQDPYLIFP